MCYLVTIGIREERAQLDALLGVDFPLAVRPSKNPSLRSAFPRADHLFEVSDGFCACDLVIQDKPRSDEDQRARLRAQYERKGWSKAKIARAVADWHAAHNRQREKSSEPARNLIKLLQTLATRLGGVRVVVHFYSGRFDTEEIPLVGRTRVPLERLEIGMLVKDTLMDVVQAG